jgi:hypothetical protein
MVSDLVRAARYACSALVVVGLLAGATGCNRWVPLQPYTVTSRGAADPGQTYRLVQQVAGQRGYQIVQQDPTTGWLSIRAHVDEKVVGRESYVRIQVYRDGRVELTPFGALVVDGRVHHLLRDELVALQGAIANPAGDVPAAGYGGDVVDIVGILVDSEGQPIAGLDVFAVESDERGQVLSGETVVTIDSQGKPTLSPTSLGTCTTANDGSFRIAVQGPGFKQTPHRFTIIARAQDPSHPGQVSFPPLTPERPAAAIVVGARTSIDLNQELGRIVVVGVHGQPAATSPAAPPAVAGVTAPISPAVLAVSRTKEEAGATSRLDPAAPAAEAGAAPGTFSIDAEGFRPSGTVDCGTEFNVVGVSGTSLKVELKTMSIRNGEVVGDMWCPRALHRWMGTLRFRGYTIASNKDRPLLFQVTRDQGYRYVGGEGFVLLPTGKKVNLK